MNLLHLLFLFISIQRSCQSCYQFLTMTTCENEILGNNYPLKISGYTELLWFQKGNLQEIPAGSFKALPNVTTLYISKNQVKNVEEGAFDGLFQLQELSLYDNELQNIKQGVFRDLKHLKSIDLAFNKIRDIEINAFVDLPSLEELDLGHNSLQVVPNGVNKIKSLKVLKLYNKKLRSVAANTFNNLNNLQLLDLSFNQISEIATNAFSGLNELIELKLQFNYLTDMNVQNVLSDLRLLAVVRLYGNSFSCSTLSSIVSTFQARGVSVEKGGPKSEDSVNGISCKKN